MQRLEGSGAVRPLELSLGVKGLNYENNSVNRTVKKCIWMLVSLSLLINTSTNKYIYKTGFMASTNLHVSASVRNMYRLD